MTEVPNSTNPQKSEMTSPYKSPLWKPPKQTKVIREASQNEESRSSPRTRLLRGEDQHSPEKTEPQLASSGEIGRAGQRSETPIKTVPSINSKNDLRKIDRKGSRKDSKKVLSRVASIELKGPEYGKKKSLDRRLQRTDSRTITLGGKKKHFLRAGSIQEEEFQDVTMDSKGDSDLFDLQNYVHAHRNHTLSRGQSRISFDDHGSPKNRRKSLKGFGDIHNLYYNALRRKIGRRRSVKLEDPQEFAEQVKEIKENIRTPNEERIRDLMIVEKSNMEKLIGYYDKYPLLNLRKKILKIPRYISIICYKIINHFLFDYIVLSVVLLNSILLALDNPTDDKPAVSPEVDNTLLGIYTTEMVLKILGMGFVIKKKSYLRDPWNVMDFIIVTTAYIPVIFSSGGVNLQAFRVLRVLRPLRTISKVQSLKVIVLTLLAAFGPLMETVFVLVFVYIIFGIAGLQLFSGLMKKRCFSVDDGTLIVDEELGWESIDFQLFCNADSDCPTYKGMTTACAKLLDNPGYGYLTFDNLPFSVLMVFQVVSTEGWSDIMYMIQKTFNPLAAIYFIALIMICTFFLLNLTLAVIKAEFTSHSHEGRYVDLNKKKHWSYDAKMMERLENNKKDVLKLVKRRKLGEVTFNKYEFKKDNLIALEGQKRGRTDKKRRRRDDKPKGRLAQRLSVFGNALKITPPRRSFGTIVRMVQRVVGGGKKGVPVSPAPVDDKGDLITKQTSTASLKSPETRFLANLKTQKPRNDTRSLTKTNLLGVQNTQEISFAKQNGQNYDDLDSHRSKPSESPLLKNSDGKNNDEIKEEGVSFEGSRANSFVAIPGIAEANEKSEQSIKTPSEVSRGDMSVKNARRRTMGLKIQKLPVRPVISEKDYLSALEREKLGDNGLISIAGIRNKSENKNELKPQLEKLRSFSQVRQTPEISEFHYDEDQSLLDHSYVSRQGGAKKKEEYPSFAKTLLMRQMNHITPFPNKKNRSHSSKNKLSAAMPSMFDLSEEVRSMGHGDSNVPSELLDDSDFFNDRQRYEMLKQRKRNKNRRKTFRSQSRVQQGSLQRLNSIEHEKEEEHLPGEGHATGGKGKKKEEEEEDQERLIIDVRHLKAIPVFEKEYEGHSIDDVMPSHHEREMKRLEEEEKANLRNTRLKMEYRITNNDRQRAADQTTARYSQTGFSSSVVGLTNHRTSRIRKIKEDEKNLEDQYSKGVLEKGSMGSMKQSFGRSGTKHSFKRKSYGTHARTAGGGGGVRRARDEDYLSQGKENDYIEVVKWMNTPLSHEEEIDNPEGSEKRLKKFDNEEQFLNIRRKDLKSYSIKSNNWSGDATLGLSFKMFPVDRVKAALNSQDFDIWRRGVLGLLHAMRRKIRIFIETSFFNNIILLSVFMNTIMLASQGLVTDQGGLDLLSTFNLIFTIIFTIEMGLKIIGLGPAGYARDFMNLFDCGIVILSLYEQSSLSGEGTSGSSAVSAFRTVRLFRTFRVLRVTKLLRTLSYMKIIIGVVMRSVKNFVFILILLFLFIFIYTLLGMQVYGGNLDLASNVGQGAIRQNFDSFLSAFLCVFQVMTQENWNDVLNLTLRSPAVNNAISLLYLISWMCIGNYIFLNLFLAILLDEFTGEEVEEELEEIEEEFEDGEIEISSKTNSLSRSGMVSSKRGTTQKTLSKDSFKMKSFESRLEASSQGESDSGAGSSSGPKSASNINRPKETVIACRRSLYIFSKTNILRRICLAIVQHPKFETVILSMIAISSIKLGIDTYITADNVQLTDISETFDDVMNIFFILEMTVKIISLGFAFDSGSYLRDTWNMLDFVIVVASIIDMTVENVDLQVVKILRLLRTLRPLRFVSHNKSMRLIVTALLESLKPMVNVVIVIVLIWLMFAILAVNIVGGKLGYCDGLPEEETYYGISQTTCISMGYTWANPKNNFDNVFWAMLTLFVLSTMENWPGIMGTVADANDAIYGPAENGNQLFAALYFIFFILIGAFFLINLFIGVIFLEYTRAEKKENAVQKFLTPEQQKWVVMQRLVMSVKPDLSNVEPDARWMKKIFRIINHIYFEIFIMTIIVLNIILMCMNFDDSSDELNQITQIINYIFSVIFAIEMVLKHMGLGFVRYWSSGWNQFDAFVVLASVLDLVMTLLEQSFLSFIKFGPQLARIFRVLRVSRLFKLIKQFQNLQKLINTLIFSLPSLINVGALLFLVYFIYSILGNFLYKNVEYGTLIGDLVNFDNVAVAFVTMFRCSTGENWQFVMYDTIYPDSCYEGTTNCETSAAIAIPFWVSFIIICRYIFLNLFILVILQQFEEYHLNPDNPVNHFRESLQDKFIPHWEKYSLKHGGAHIHESQVFDFFLTLDQPLGFKGSTLLRKEVAKQVMRMNIPSDEDKMVFYNDMIYATFKNAYNSEPISDFSQFQYLLKEETKTKKRLDKLKKKAAGLKQKKKLDTKQKTFQNKVGGANAITKLLFMGMTMKAWIRYSYDVAAKMKAAQEKGFDYVPSESDENDYYYGSEESESFHDEDSSDQDDEYETENLDRVPEENEGQTFDEDWERSRASPNMDEKGSKDIQTQPLLNASVMDGLNNQGEDPLDKSQYLESLKQQPPKIKGLSSRNISPLFDRKDPSFQRSNRNRSYSNLTAPKIIMHTVEGEMHNLTPKVVYSFVDQERSPKNEKSPRNEILGSAKNSKQSLDISKS